MLSLYVTPEIRRFGPGDDEKLLAALRQLERHTHTEHVDDPEQLLLLQTSAKTKGGLRYSALAFAQVASLLAPGLARLIPNLWGYTKRAKFKDSQLFYNHAVAINVFNQIVAARFEATRGQRLVIDRDQQLIIGLISKNYAQLDNSDFVTLAHEAVKDSVFAVDAYEALLVGRQLSLRFRSQMPFTIIKPPTGRKSRVFVGYGFRNGETHGLAVRAYRAIITDRGTALWEFKSGRPMRAAHKGANFDERAFSVIQSVIVQDMKMLTPVKTWSEQLLQRPLNLESGTTVREKQIGDMAGAFVKRGLPRWLSIKILERAAYVGLQLHDVSGQDLASRTAYDVYCAITDLASGFETGRRERLERLAYDFLRGNIKL